MTAAPIAPCVLILEGLAAPPVAYRRVRTRLLERGAQEVDLAPVGVHDWLAAGIRGFGALQRRVAAAMDRSAQRAGAPILVVGHSGGGILARLAMAQAPYRGYATAMAQQVGCLVTLGTPHLLHASTTRHRHAGVALSAHLDDTEPGAWFAPATGYVTVASDLFRPPIDGWRPPVRHPVARLQRELFGRIVGPLPTDGSDGVVPAAWAHLEGATQLTYHDVLHGVVGGPWYGDAAIIDRWWPVAVGAWSRALRLRSVASSGGAAR